jgi:hypothetical protein
MMTDEVQILASRHGFQLDQVERDGQTLWAWRRGKDTRWPWFLTERAALEWMHERQQRATVGES